MNPRLGAMRTNDDRQNDNLSLNTHTAPIKVDVNLVLVSVSIVDPLNRQVTGLGAADFAIF